MYSGCTTRGHAPTRAQSIPQTLLPSAPWCSRTSGSSRAVVVQTESVPDWLAQLVGIAQTNDSAGLQAGRRGRIARAAKRTPAHISITHVEIGEDLLALIDQKRSRIIWVMTADGDSEPLASKVKRLLYLTHAKDVWVASQHASAEMPLAKAIMRACNTPSLGCNACEVNTKLDTFHPAQVAMMLEEIPPSPSDGITLPIRKAFATPNRPASKEMRLRRPKEDEYTYMHMRKRRLRTRVKDEPGKPSNRPTKHASLIKPILEQKLSPTVIGINGHLLLTQNRHVELMWSQLGHTELPQLGQVGRALGFLKPLPFEGQRQFDNVLNDDFAFRDVEIVDPTDPTPSQDDEKSAQARNKTPSQHTPQQEGAQDEDQRPSMLMRAFEAVNRTLQEEMANIKLHKASEPHTNHGSHRSDRHVSSDSKKQDEGTSKSSGSHARSYAEEYLLHVMEEPAGSLQDDLLIAMAELEQKRQNKIGWVKDPRFAKVKLHIEAWLENNEMDFVPSGSGPALQRRQSRISDNQPLSWSTAMYCPQTTTVQPPSQKAQPATSSDESLVLRRPKLRPQTLTSSQSEPAQEQAQTADASDSVTNQQAEVQASQTYASPEAQHSKQAAINTHDQADMSEAATSSQESNPQHLSNSHQLDTEQHTEDPDFQLLQAFIDHMNQAEQKDDLRDEEGIDEFEDEAVGVHDAKTPTAGSNQPARSPTDSNEEALGLAAFADLLRSAKSISLAVQLSDGTEHKLIDVEPSKMQPGAWQQVVDSALDKASGVDRQATDKTSKPHSKDKSLTSKTEKALAEVLGMIGRSRTDQADDWVLNTSTVSTASNDDGSSLPQFNCQMSFGPDERDVTVFFNVDDDARKLTAEQNLGNASHRLHLNNCYTLNDAPSGMEMRMLNSVMQQLQTAWKMKPPADSTHPECQPPTSKAQETSQPANIHTNLPLQPEQTTQSSVSNQQPSQQSDTGKQTSDQPKSSQPVSNAMPTDADSTIRPPPVQSNVDPSDQNTSKEGAGVRDHSASSQIDDGSVGNDSDAVLDGSDAMSSSDRSSEDAFCIVPPPADSPGGQPVVSKEAKNNFYSNAISSHNSSDAANESSMPQGSTPSLASQEQPSSTNQPAENAQPSQSKALEAQGLDPVELAEALVGRRMSRKEADELLAALASAESLFTPSDTRESSSSHSNGQSLVQANKDVSGMNTTRADGDESSRSSASTKASAADGADYTYSSTENSSNDNSSTNDGLEDAKTGSNDAGADVTVDDIVAAFRRDMDQAFGGSKKAKKRPAGSRKGRAKGIHEVSSSRAAARPPDALKSLFDELERHLPSSEPPASVAGKPRTTRARQLKLRVTRRVKEVYSSWAAHGRGLEKYSDLMPSGSIGSISKNKTFTSLEAAQVVSRLVDILSRRCDGVASKEGQDLVVVLPTPSLAESMIEAARERDRRHANLEIIDNTPYLPVKEAQEQAPQQMQTGQFILGDNNIIEVLHNEYIGFGGIRVLDENGMPTEQQKEEEEVEEEEEEDRVSQAQLLELLAQCWSDWEQELMAANVKATGMLGSQM